ncbi:hypothetical protein LCGC14_2478430 [marine sediment metagenome]|uniref:Uncharacterized protein n=1 Tax=marine sediment metagenome TaxID=412755 RepID=A0A0F9DKB8_9ZZZZ
MIIDTTGSDQFAIKQREFALKMLDAIPWPKRTLEEKKYFISCLPECLLKEVAEAMVEPKRCGGLEYGRRGGR